MLYVLAAYYARGRFLSAVRQSAPSGTSRRGFETPGLRLLVTGSIHYTIKIASAVSRRRRKSKIVHAQRPDQIPPRAFYASPSFPRRREPREKQSTPLTPFAKRKGARAERAGDAPVFPAQAGTQRKQSTPPIPTPHMRYHSPKASTRTSKAAHATLEGETTDG